MAAENFAQCLQAFWQFDGLRNDAAPGEKFRTAFGVTEMTWANAVEQGIVEGGLNQGTEADFEKILHLLYWDVCKCDEMPDGADLMLFNDATLSGTGHTIRLLQRTVGTAQDGIIGNMTFAAIYSMSINDLIKDLSDADEHYLTSLRNANLYLKGWTRREVFMKTLALKMSDAGPLSTAPLLQ